MSKKIISMFISVVMITAMLISSMAISGLAAPSTSVADGSQTLTFSKNNNINTYSNVETVALSSGVKKGDTVYKVTHANTPVDSRIMKNEKNSTADIWTSWVETEFRIDNENVSINVYIAPGKDLSGTDGLKSNNDYYYFPLMNISLKDGLVIKNYNDSGKTDMILSDASNISENASAKIADVEQYKWHKIRITTLKDKNLLRVNFDNEIKDIPLNENGALDKYGMKFFNFSVVGNGINGDPIYLDNLKWATAYTNSDNVDKAAVETDSTYTYEWTNTTNFDYELLNANEAIITGFKNNIIPTLTDGVLEIPAEIQGYSVNKIANYAFSKNEDGTNSISQESTRYADVKKLVLNEGLTDIGEYAFCALLNNTEIITPSTLKTIGTAAFAANKKVTKIVLNSGLTTIGSSAFTNCAYGNTPIKEIVIPVSVTDLQGSLFRGCWVEKVVFKGDTNISTGLFYNAAKLKELVVEGNIGTVTNEVEIFGGACSKDFVLYTSTANASKLTKELPIQVNHYTAKIDVADGNYAARVFDDITAKVIVANYTDNEATSINAPVDVTKAAPVTAVYSDGMGIFVWEDMSTLKPLCPAYK